VIHENAVGGSRAEDQLCSIREVLDINFEKVSLTVLVPHKQTVTSTQTFDCPWLSAGGMGFGGMAAATPTMDALLRRQGSSSASSPTASVAPTTTAASSTATASTGLLGTTTLKLTNTVYTPVTVAVNGTRTAMGYACSAASSSTAA